MQQRLTVAVMKEHDFKDSNGLTVERNQEISSLIQKWKEPPKQLKPAADFALEQRLHK